MRTFQEFAQTAANITGANAGQIIQQLDPTMRGQWDKLVMDFPRLYGFLGDLYKISKGTWKVAPAQFTTLLNKHLVGIAGAKNIAQTAPLATR
jgi:hypothetical protein